MHPILGPSRRLAVFGALWLPASGLVGVSVASATQLPPAQGLLLAVPPALLLGFVSLAAWWAYGRIPLSLSSSPRLFAAHGGGAVVSEALWLVAGRGWVRVLSAGWPAAVVDPGALERWPAIEPLWLASGLWLYFLGALLHYLAFALEVSKRAESRALDLRVQTREAELKALRAQVDPHFLFNCLHSISALCVSEPVAARRMAVLLADFFRGSLRAGRQEAHPLEEELALASAYLEIERVRLGSRLRLEVHIPEEALPCQVPPLLLQPLVENAVKHGIGHLVEGGVVRLEARVQGGRLEIEVENPCDPDRTLSRGAQVGLANVRARLLTRYGPKASLEVVEEVERFCVSVALPADRPRGDRQAEPSSAPRGGSMGSEGDSR